MRRHYYPKSVKRMWRRVHGLGAGRRRRRILRRRGRR